MFTRIPMRNLLQFLNTKKHAIFGNIDNSKPRYCNNIYLHQLKQLRF